MSKETAPRKQHRARVRGVEPVVQAAAENLRKNETVAEDPLWQALRGRKVAGRKFRRQHAVGPYILDFYCPEHKLVVEVDGGVHEKADAREHDTLRTEHIERYGYHVLRFTNDDVLRRLPFVLAAITQAVASDHPPLSPPFPSLGERAGG